MPIEIKELVIRATVDDTAGTPPDTTPVNGDTRTSTSVSDEVDMILQMINNKNER